ncbi:MAG TPA: Crp/Fnr family transcriptional regulator [Blastocatellia bacterium]|nr:Crp/Fnr family transcriptional regulator [Blastocatellia bacterium]
MGIARACDPSSLSGIALFRDLTEPHLLQLTEMFRHKTYPAGATLMTFEQPGEAVYFILAGTVKVHVEQEDGRDVIISILGPGECVGEMSLLDQVGRSATVVTIEESEMLWLDRATFRRFLLEIPALAYNLACVLSARLRLANDQIQALAAREAETRIARHILAFAQRYGRQLPNGDLFIPIRLTQSDIAALTGASREHTNKILVSYKERGYISADRRHYLTVHNQRALAKRC